MAQKIKKLKENQRKIRVFIISGGYGVIDALEPINDYEAVMKGKVSRFWRDNGLSDIIKYQQEGTK